MIKPVIGIVGRVLEEPRANFHCDEEYRLAIIKAGGIPIMLLPFYSEKISNVTPFQNDFNFKQDKMLDQLVQLCDGILFPGGLKWYGFDQMVYECAKKYDKAILGICLGMQMIANQTFFSSSNSDHTVRCTSHLQSDFTYAHLIHINESKLLQIFEKNTILVNSRHSCCILDHNSFHVSSYSMDGIIESIEIPNQNFIIGVQWHPESLYDFDVYSQKLFSAFIQAAQKKGYDLYRN
ncbi:MAG: C26 family cysteine hydrolase domain-containing family [Bacilli bacterium]|nr:C26 family cysteine hydrolase domain-containing family [Bacilli bacterium]